ncbi:unnamed protein product [Calypogeia fissa]
MMRTPRVERFLLVVIVVLSIRFSVLSPASAQECPLLFSPTDVIPSESYNYSSPAFKTLFSTLNTSIGNYITQHGIQSYAVAIVHQNRTIFTSGLTTTRFRIASITKTFTALGALMLRDQGRLLLDDPVKKFLPSFSIINPFGEHETTLRELMGHAAGFPQQLCPYLMTCTDNETEILQQIGGMQLISPPWGDFPAYSNMGIALLGRAWEKATDGQQSWEDFVAESILKPLGMSNSGVNVSGVELAPNGNPWALQDLGWSAPAAQMYSTAEDLTKYLKFLINADPPLISKTSIREWTSPATIFTDQMGGYSFPWELVKLYPNSTDFLITKSGNINYYLSRLAFDPPTELGAVVLAVIDPQISSGSADELGDNIMRTIIPAVQTVNQNILTEIYAGVYTCPRSSSFVGPTLNYSVEVKTGTINVSVSPTVGLLADVDISLSNAGQPVSTVGTWALLLKNGSENSFWFGDGSVSCSGIVGSVSSGPDLDNPNTPGSLYTDVVVFDPVKGSLQWPAVADACYKAGFQPSEGFCHSPITFFCGVIISVFLLFFTF